MYLRRTYVVEDIINIAARFHWLIGVLMTLSVCFLFEWALLILSNIRAVNLIEKEQLQIVMAVVQVLEYLIAILLLIGTLKSLKRGKTG